MKWFRGGLVFKAHRLLYHSTAGVRVIKRERERERERESINSVNKPYTLYSKP